MVHTGALQLNRSDSGTFYSLCDKCVNIIKLRFTDIDINTAKDIVDELIQNGYVSGRPSIGITGQNVESADGKVSGVQVYSIDSRAKAASEGLQVGDVITAVSQNPDAIGYASLASIKDTVKALNVDGVTPGEATVKDGSYKVQRPFVLVTVDGKALSPAAQAFFDYATSSDAASIIAKAGAVAVAG